MKYIVIAALGAAIFGIGLAVGTAIVHRSAPAAETPQTVQPAPEPATSARDTAVIAAAHILYAFDLRTVLDPTVFDRVVRRVAAPGRGRQIAALFGDGIQDVRAMFAGAPRISRAAPLGFRLLRFAPPEASVAIWNVAIGAGPLVTPTAQWRTIVLDLRLAGGRWKAVGGRSMSGPSPDTSLRELAQRANAVEKFSYVP